MTETPILDERAVSEIEARKDAACRPEENWQQWHDLILWILNTDIPALCATVKHLRAENQRLAKERDRAREDVRILTKGRFIQS